MFKVLFQARHNIFDSRGGDTVQLEMSMKYLIEMGISVTVDFSKQIDCSQFDIIHLFNVTSPESTLLQLRNAKNQNKIVCISPIYWNIDELEKEMEIYKKTEPYIVSKVRFVRNKVMSLFSEEFSMRYNAEMLRNTTDFREIQRNIFDNVDMILPNSKTELDMIYEDFPSAVNKAKHVVYNGYDERVFTRDDVKSLWGVDNAIGNYALCVGRIEPRKNQLRLIKSLRNTDIPVVLVGRSINKIYLSEILKYMKSTDIIIEEMKQENLRDIYAGAKVHVLPSFYDTPGLVSLEAGAVGCNIVTSNIGSQEEYFGNLVEYCNPYDERNIRRCIYRSMEKDWPNIKIMNHISQNFTWEISAKQTFQAYQDILSPYQRPT